MPTRIFEALCYLAPHLNESCIRDRNDSIADVCRDAIACRGFRSSADDDQASGDSKDGHLYEAADVCRQDHLIQCGGQSVQGSNKPAERPLGVGHSSDVG